MVNTTRWVTHFLKEIAAELIVPVRKRERERKDGKRFCIKGATSLSSTVWQ